MKKYGFIFFVLGLLNALAQADDTEVYLGDPNAVTAKPNVLFVFDTSGSMKDSVKGTGKTRLQVTQEAAKNTINNLSGINIALMQFNHKRTGEGGVMSLPMGSVDDATHKQNLINTINGYKANGGTPIVESIHEAYLYMTGDLVKYGRNKNTMYSHADTYTGSGSTAKYITPITETCQKNHIVLFTDGAASSDTGSNQYVKNLLEEKFSAADLGGTGLDMANKCNPTCLGDLAYIMNNSDVSPLDGKQTIQFHSIGGFIGEPTQGILDRAAKLGGGVSANAQTPEDLEEALLKVFQNIVQTGGTFAAPTVAVNAFNNLEQLDQMYYSVFQPHEAVGWSGNVKRYRMAGGKIVDVNNADAIDGSTGFFNETAQSFWSEKADGEKITAGGMASRLQDERIVVSNLVSNTLMDEKNRIRSSNKLITQDLMGTKLKDANFEGSDLDPTLNPDGDTSDSEPYTTAEFTKLVNWVGGLEAKDKADKSRRSMEDPLHSNPVLLNYGELSIGGKKVPDSTLFVGTNSGYLHAFDTNANSPKERFAFIPKELLPVATKYYEKVGKKRYGLDGYITVWHDDTNKDMIINNGEKAYLYVGMRRGGSSYYALDVSNRDNPKLLWQINGKGYQNGPTQGFEELGQTWSKMVPADVMWKGAKKKVLFFAGGYDIVEDTRFIRTDHSVGNALYMVDAKSGDLLWKASKTTGHLKIADMKSAITGNIVPVDDNSDGYVDLLYVADLGGRIFRIDFNRAEAKSGSTNPTNYATGGMIADLGANNSQIDHVRFYETLDVVYSREFSYVEGTGNNQRFIQKPRYMLNIGSGYRAHPLDASALDNFYVVFDYNTEGPARNAQGNPTYNAIVKTDLQKYEFSGTGDLSLEPTTKSNNGFYLRLISASGGEKSLSSSITLDNTIYFTTFRPSDGTSSNSCSADLGSSRLYRIKLSAGRSSIVKNEDIDIPGIPPKPVIITGDNSSDDSDTGLSDPKILISTKIFDTEGSKYPLKKTFWRELNTND